MVLNSMVAIRCNRGASSGSMLELGQNILATVVVT